MFSSSRSRSARVLLLEGLVIVASILLAFGLEAWWDYRNERKAEAVVLQNLLEEFVAAGTELDFYLGLDRRVEEAASTTLAALQEARDEGREFVSIRDTALALIMIPGTFDPQLGTLAGLLSSGGLPLLRDTELQRALAGWPGLLTEASEEERASHAHVYERLGPTLWDRIDGTGFALIGESIALGDPDPGLVERETRLPVDNPVLGVMATRLALITHQINELVAVRLEIDRIIALIEESLDP